MYFDYGFNIRDISFSSWRVGGYTALPLGDLIFYGLGTIVTIDDATYLKAFKPAGNSDVAQVKGVRVLGDGTGYGTVLGLTTGCTFVVGTGSGVPTCTVDGRLDIATGVSVWGLEIYFGSLLISKLNMCAGTDTLHPDLELSVAVGGLNCKWAGFSSVIYAESTDGSGFNLNEEGWSVADGSTMYADSANTTLLLAGSRIPPGAGFDGSGIALVTQNPGPIAASMKTVGIPCVQGGGTGSVFADPVSSISELTLEVEFEYKTQTALEILLNVGGGGGETGYLGLSASGVICGGVGSNYFGTIFGTTTLVDGVHYKAKISWDGSVVTLSLSVNVGDYTVEYSDTQNGNPVANSTVINASSTGLYASQSKIFNAKIYGGNDTLIHHYPLEAGTGTIAEDIISGNNGTLTSFAGDPWSTRDVGECLMCKNGFSIDHLGIGTGVSVCNDDGIHQDDTVPTYPRNTMLNALNAPVLHAGALGPLTQGVTALTAETQIDLTALLFNTDDQFFVCNNGLAYYTTAQGAENILNIGFVLCGHIFPFTFPFSLG